MTKAETLVSLAKGELGKPYELHRDCSGFTAWLYRQIGITIPEGSVAQWNVGDEVNLRQMQAGDLVFWSPFGNRLGHVAMAINPSQVIHAINEDDDIIISNIHDEMGGPLVGVRRVLPVEEAGDTTPPETDDPKHHRRKNRRHHRKDRA
jgi:cell wall-associated NlpC family hydrolase